jgi:hypothetical protein
MEATYSFRDELVWILSRILAELAKIDQAMSLVAKARLHTFKPESDGIVCKEWSGVVAVEVLYLAFRGEDKIPSVARCFTLAKNF